MSRRLPETHRAAPSTKPRQDLPVHHPQVSVLLTSSPTKHHGHLGRHCPAVLCSQALGWQNSSGTPVTLKEHSGASPAQRAGSQCISPPTARSLKAGRAADSRPLPARLFPVGESQGPCPSPQTLGQVNKCTAKPRCLPRMPGDKGTRWSAQVSAA